MQVRKRAVELQALIAQLQARFEAQHANFTFDAMLSEFAVVANQFSQLHAHLRPQLQFYAVHPMHLTPANHLCALDSASTSLLCPSQLRHGAAWS